MKDIVRLKSYPVRASGLSLLDEMPFLGDRYWKK